MIGSQQELEGSKVLEAMAQSGHINHKGEY